MAYCSLLEGCSLVTRQFTFTVSSVNYHWLVGSVCLVIVFRKFFKLFPLLLENRLFNSEVERACFRGMESSASDLTFLVHCLVSSGHRAYAAFITIGTQVKAKSSSMGACELSSPLGPVFRLAQVSAMSRISFSMLLFNCFVVLMDCLYNLQLL